MKISELVFKLLEVQKEHGDLDVEITDGYRYLFYKGEFSIEVFKEGDYKFLDLGIGGCEQCD